MDDYLKDLYQQIKPIETLHNECEDSSDVVLKMFTDKVETIYSYREEDYAGEVYVVYKYKGKYFDIIEEFGSCDHSDGWIAMERDCDKRERLLASLKDVIAKNVVDHLNEITYPLSTPYINPKIKTGWLNVLDKYGVSHL